MLNISLMLLLCAATCTLCTSSTHEERRMKRADDTDPLQPVVEQLTQQVQQLQAELTQLRAQVEANKNNIDGVKTVIGFTVRMRTADVQGLGQHQIVKFDDVHFNAGNGYSTTTGLFTAPLSGTYVFVLKTMRHGTDDPYIALNVVRNGVLLGQAHGGYSNYESGSSGLYLVHLDKGDVVGAEVDGGSMFWGGVHTVFSGFRLLP